jgi:alkanesulfonate monooxygenase SsuD/methylene tetrahydromethanopterin reductase-like flavin-dependent oxidoreductase (luciferase family)
VATQQALHFGLTVFSHAPWPELVQRTRLAEELGFDSIWVTDHFIAGEDEQTPIQEAYSVLAGLAMATERVRLGVMVCGNTYRNPAFLLKQAVTVDHISNGRVDFGIGAGWWEREHEAYGYAFPDKGELVGRFAEALAVTDSLQRQERTNFDGKYYRYVNTPLEPKPIQRPKLPVVIGAGKPRMLRLTAEYADIWNTRGKHEDAVERGRILDEKCREIGRDPGEIVRSVWPFDSQLTSEEAFSAYVETFIASGFRHFIFGWPKDADELGVLKRVAASRIPDLRRL